MLLGKVLALGAVAALTIASIVSSAKDWEKEERRKNTPCRFDDVMSESDFATIVRQTAKRYRRISDLEINGPVIKGTLHSQSGITKWPFTIDFNNYGHITGTYWINCKNSESNLPTSFADSIKEAMNAHYAEVNAKQANKTPNDE